MNGRKLLLISLIAVSLSLLLLIFLSVNTSNSAGWTFLYDNLFWALVVGAFTFYLGLRFFARNVRVERGLIAALLASILVILIGVVMFYFGPRVATEADHPATITYLCSSYGNDLPVLEGKEALCVIKNPITASSNPAWLIFDSLGAVHDTAERLSQITTFLLAISIMSGAYIYFSREEDPS